MFLKDPDAVIDFGVDWTTALGAGATIAESAWSIAPVETGGLAQVSASLDGSVSTVRLSGGVPGHLYQVGNRVTLADGARDERSLTVRVENR
jgi:hypothetical protein